MFIHLPLIHFAPPPRLLIDFKNVCAEVNLKEQLSSLRVYVVLKTWKCPDWRCIQNEDGVEITLILFVLYEELFCSIEAVVEVCRRRSYSPYCHIQHRHEGLRRVLGRLITMWRGAFLEGISGILRWFAHGILWSVCRWVEDSAGVVQLGSACLAVLLVEPALSTMANSVVQPLQCWLDHFSSLAVDSCSSK